MLQLNSTTLNLALPFQYYFKKGSSNKTVLLLHGYRMHGRKALLDFESMIPTEYNIVAPNGFFPIPKSDKHITRMGYSWYFDDHKSEKALVTVEQSTLNLYEALKQNDLLNNEITIFGFSQGGVIGLSLASKLEKIQNLVLLSMIPKLSNYQGEQKLNILAIHGKEDELMNHEMAEANYQELEKDGHKVKLLSFEKVGHNLAPAAENFSKEINQYLKDNL